MNFGQVLGLGGEVLEVALEVETVITMDTAQIKAGLPATSPSVGGSVAGVAGKFTVTFTPDAHAHAAAEAAPAEVTGHASGGQPVQGGG